MNCEELQPFLHGYVDGELDLGRNLEVERHLQECPTCAGSLGKHQMLRKALRDDALYHRCPADLRGRIRSSLQPARKRRAAFLERAWRPLAIAASLAFVALLTWDLVRKPSVPPREDLLAQTVLSDHLRSLMTGNLIGKETSSDRHVLKPWFSRELPFSPEVKDLAKQGFPLVGGRLETIDNTKAAALVYKRNQHIINVFIWLANGRADEPIQELKRQGYHLFHWTQGGLTYWVVSDLNEKEQREFIELIQH